MYRSILRACIISFVILASPLLCAGTSVVGTEYPVGSGIVGDLRTHTIQEDESLIELARTFDIGYNEVVAANPGVDPFIPDPGTRVTIPTCWIIPDLPRREGIVVNLAEMRLYYFPPRQPAQVVTFPIGIGDEGWETPIGTYRVVGKLVNPPWRVPASIRRKQPWLPAVVPPGDGNPLGTHALRLSSGSLLIHGTGRPFGIGRQISHGCIHLYPEDIPRLFGQVRIGTRVTIIRQPVKVVTVSDRVMVEVHESPGEDLGKAAYDMIMRKGVVEKVDLEKLTAALRKRTGIPTDVTW